MDKVQSLVTTPFGSPPQIVMVDFDSGAEGNQALIAKALQSQVQEHFGLAPPYGWGLSASVRLARSEKDILPGEWILGLYRHPDQPGALGYHDRTGATPLMKIFPQLDMQDGTPWSTTASHEILETLLDPELSRCVQAPSGHFWALEVCDFVESESYKIDGIDVSNFSLPAAFEPPAMVTTATRFDWMGTSTAAFQIKPGGYGSYWDGRKWTQSVKSEKSQSRITLDAWGISRHLRRAKKHSRVYAGHPSFV